MYTPIWKLIDVFEILNHKLQI